MSLVLTAEAQAKFPYLLDYGNDHKAWAKRILYREERGDKTLSTLQVQFAKEAMGLIEPAEAK
jgi:hypothetical protein